MVRSLGIAATGMQAQQLNVDVIANNIANLSTTGFKRERAAFQDLLYQNVTRPGATSTAEGNVIPTGIQVGLGVSTGAIYRIHEQGGLTQTNNDFDVAISGRGFFVITEGNGEQAFTRDGSFQVNNDGDLVTADGLLVSPGITIPDDAIDVEINGAGEVLVSIDGQIEPSNVGQIELATFVNEAGLEAIGGNLLKESEASGTPTTGFAAEDGFGELTQGFLELSNVDAVTELTTLITAQRAFDLNSRIITTTDEMLQTIGQIR